MNKKDEKVNKIEWAIEPMTELANKLKEHGYGFIVIPFANDDKEAEKHSENNEPSFMLTNLYDPMTFGAAISMAISQYCRKFGQDPRHMLESAIETSKLVINNDKLDKTETFTVDKNNNVKKDNTVTISMEQLMHPERFNKNTEDGVCWGRLEGWERNIVRNIEKEIDKNTSYLLSFCRHEKVDGEDGTRISVCGNTRGIDALGSLSSQLSTICSRCKLDLDEACELIKQIARDEREDNGN